MTLCTDNEPLAALPIPSSETYFNHYISAFFCLQVRSVWSLTVNQCPSCHSFLSPFTHSSFVLPYSFLGFSYSIILLSLSFLPLLKSLDVHLTPVLPAAPVLLYLLYSCAAHTLYQWWSLSLFHPPPTHTHKDTAGSAMPFHFHKQVIRFTVVLWDLSTVLLTVIQSN